MLEVGRRAGFEQGFQQGMERGMAEGRDEGLRRLEEEAEAARQASAGRLARLDQLLAAVAEGIARRLAEAEDDMVALCHEVICRILGEHLSTREGVIACVRRAVEEAGSSGPPGSGRSALELHVHPRDLAAIEGDPAFGDWLQQHASAGGSRWIPDERVELGGCLVRSVEGTLDARLETQLAVLQALLRRGATSRAREAPEAAAASRGGSA
jgi:flagellar assembly protein FliH